MQLDPIQDNGANQQAPSQNGENSLGALLDLATGNPGQAMTDQFGSNPNAIRNNVLGMQRGVGVGGFNGAMAGSLIGPAWASSPLGKLIGGGQLVTSEAGNVARLPSFLKSLMRTGAAMNQAGNVRNLMLKDAQGVTAQGDNIVNAFANRAKNALMGTQDNADQEAINNATTNVQNKYGGQTFNPNQLKSYYDAVQNAYTKGGIIRTPIQATVDNMTKQTLGGALGDSVPGWNAATNKMSQLYNLESSPVKKVVGRGVATGIGGILSLLGLEGLKNTVFQP